MKKADMIKRVAEWNKKITKECEKRDMCFIELQELAVEMGYAMSCSAFENFKNIISTPHVGPETLRIANKAYSDYCFLDGKHETLIDFLQETDNFNL